jgi:5-methylcytosine-specific restriction endonuclease McrBC regulatory subunit McrC
MKIHIQRKVVDELADSLDQSFNAVNDELCNDRPVITGYSTSGLMEIDKDHLDKQIAGLITVINKLKSIKEFNPKKPL